MTATPATPMTMDEFIERLSQTKGRRKWRLRDGAIRCGSTAHTHCPISALTGKLNDFCNPIAAAKKMGMRVTVAKRIVRAADATGEEEPELRSRLLQAVGLEP